MVSNGGYPGVSPRSGVTQPMKEISEKDYETAYSILEQVRESLVEDGMEAEAATINEAHALVQEVENDN